MAPQMRDTLWGVVLLLAVTAAPSAALPDGCPNAGAANDSERAIVTHLRCGRRALRLSSDLPCRGRQPPACATDAVGELGQLLAVAEPPALRHEDSVAQRRCQAAMVRAAERFVRTTVRFTIAGFPYRRVHRSASRAFDGLASICSVDVVRTAAGEQWPRLGGRCSNVGGEEGQPFDLRRVRSCLIDEIAYQAERIVRGWLRPNIVFIYTDDQRWDTLPYMPTVQAELVGKGVEFTNAYVTTALCCPARASVLTGQYSFHHGVLGNGFPFLGPGGMRAFDDSSTFATWLSDVGYRNALFGKYLNGYNVFAPYIPPGWDRWSVFFLPEFFDYRLVEDGEDVAYGGTDADYSTDVLANQVVDYIRTAGDRPFFVWYGPYAPHEPAPPAARHAGTFAGIPPWRPPSFNEPDVSDKPPWFDIRNPMMTPEDIAELDASRELQLESLQAVDEAVGAIVDALRDTGHERNTMIVFTTDNGFAWGEHRWRTKLCPYEECRRVPLVIRYPALTPEARQESRFALNVDLAPTFAALANAVPEIPQDGASLVPLLDQSDDVTWRTEILGEHWGVNLPTYALVQDAEWKWIEYLVGHGAELYHLPTDPHELHNLSGDWVTYLPRMVAMRDRLRALRPTWPPANAFDP